METLYVRAHWTGSPASNPQVDPIPAVLAAYGSPPTVPTSPFPRWSGTAAGPVAPADAYHVWCPLVAQADLDTAQWGANTVAPPPAWGSQSGAPASTFDQGYGAGTGATGFQVTAVSLYCGFKEDSGYTFDLWEPAGTHVGTVTPTGSGWTPFPLAAPIADGKGLWRIRINRPAGALSPAPLMATGSAPPAGVDEPYVQVGGMALGLSFSGNETGGSPSAPVTVSAAGTFGLGDCDASGNREASTLTVAFSPALPVGTTYTITWNTGAGPVTPGQPVTVAGTPLASLSLPVSYTAGSTYFPSATISLSGPGVQNPTPLVVTFASGTAPGTVVVGTCPAPAPQVITATGAVVVGDCAGGYRQDSSLALSFSPGLPVGTTYTIAWNTGAGPSTPGQPQIVTGSPLTGITIPVSYSPGTYYPTATITISGAGVQPATLDVTFATGTAPDTVVVGPCPAVPSDCYDVAVSFSPSQPCVEAGGSVAVTFTATVTPMAGSPPPYGGAFTWEVRNLGNNQIVPFPGPAPTGPSMTFAFTAQGQFQVTAGISNLAGCTPQNPTDTAVVTVVSCSCPTIVGPILQTGAGCSLAFSVTVSNPTAAALSFTWSFGDGSPPQTGGASITHTYPVGTVGVVPVSVTVTSPGCSDSASLNVKVGCSAPPTSSTTSSSSSSSSSTSVGPGGGLCGALLVAALICAALADLAFIIWGCLFFTPIPPVQVSATVFLVLAIVFGVLALALLALWLLLCVTTSGPKACGLLTTAMDWISAFEAVQFVAMILLLIFAPPCGLGAIVGFAYFGTIMAILWALGHAFHCW